MEAARLMLGAGETAVKAVASHLGFRHAAQFTQWFKRHHGCPPVEFRRKGEA
ncbi:MAG: helix-turn-helix transcriptional regulator [Opitutus sp.]|nr:helix-turn-helix transcriptional regulator [Opitutus sp.]